MAGVTMVIASIPSPAIGVWTLGPVLVRAYALCIIAGVLAATWWAERRHRARGGEGGVLTDVATLAVPFGILGARVYHVVTDPQLYFADGRDPVTALYVWEGGLGIWGGIAGGALGAYLAARRHGLPMHQLAAIVAPCIPLAQAIGRWGNWFNQELFGRPSDLPWALEIAPENRPQGYEYFSTFHPTFLYEVLWNVGLVLLILWAERWWRMAGWRLFAVYVAGYTLGRAWIEYLRIDPVNEFLGLRLNDWTSLVLFIGAVTYLAATRPSAIRPIQAVPEDEVSTRSDPSAGRQRAPGTI